MKERSLNKSFCHIVPSRKKGKGRDRSAFYEHRGSFRWKGIADQPYKTAGSDWSNVMRRVLIGDHGENTRFHLRYFEIASGGSSSLEYHCHEHVVICVRGRGMVRYGRRTREMRYMDILFTAPNAIHRLYNPFSEPFGFLCIVNAKRDRPKAVKGCPACFDPVK